MKSCSLTMINEATMSACISFVCAFLYWPNRQLLVRFADARQGDDTSQTFQNVNSVSVCINIFLRLCLNG